MSSDFNLSLEDLMAEDDEAILREIHKQQQDPNTPLRTTNPSTGAPGSPSVLDMGKVLMGYPLYNDSEHVQTTQELIFSHLLVGGIADLKAESKDNADIEIDGFKTSLIIPQDILSEARTFREKYRKAYVEGEGEGGGTDGGAEGYEGVPEDVANSEAIKHTNPNGPSVGKWTALMVSQNGDAYYSSSQEGRGITDNPNPSSFDCIAEDTPVWTEFGPVPIQDIKPGMKVYSITDNGIVLKSVLAWVNKGEQDVYEVKTRTASLKVTSNHKIMTVQRDNQERERDTQTGQFKPIIWKTEWQSIDGGLSKRSVVLAAKELPEVDCIKYIPGTKLEVSEDFMWLAGLFVADGHTYESSIKICVYDDIRDRATKILETLLDLNVTHHATHGLYATSSLWAETLRKMELINGSLVKRIPSWVWQCNKSLQRAFLDGYLDGDGSYSTRRYEVYEVKTANKWLAHDIRMLANSLGMRTTNIGLIRRTKPIFIKGIQVKDAKDLHCFEIYPDSIRNHSKLDMKLRGMDRVIPEGVKSERICSIKYVGREPTYDIEVEDTHTFLADGRKIKNCSGLMWWATNQLIPGTDFARVSGPQWQYCVDRGTVITIDQAKRTKGALIWPNAHGEHIGCSLGDGTVIESSGSAGTRRNDWGYQSRLTWAKGALHPLMSYKAIAAAASGASSSGGNANLSIIGTTVSGASEDTFGGQNGPPETRMRWAAVFLKALLGKVTLNNMITMVAWQYGENTNAKFNPLATSQSWPGATNFNHIPVRNYATPSDGFNATIKTIKNGYYNNILAGLQKDQDPNITLAAYIGGNPFGVKDLNTWGTGSLAQRNIPRAIADINARASLKNSLLSTTVTGSITSGAFNNPASSGSGRSGITRRRVRRV